MTAENRRFWELLGDTGRETLTALAERRVVKQAQRLCAEGTRSSTVLVVLSGDVRITSVTPDGREVLLAVRGAGDLVGELAAINSRPRSASVEALGMLEVLEVPGHRFTALCHRDPVVCWAVLRVTADRLMHADKHWQDVSGGSGLRRVAAQLVQLALERGVRRGDDVDIAVPATQDELAMTVAMSRTSWARATRDLRRQGVISTGRRQVTIHRMAELRRLAS
ncbi:Crp/Fnr family transcriptional regulator [Amycolatopsis sp. OK19-0408]|uniref:Crp/Fnr family transcriptional regulator n=1 Tax=Amycolatopsis iheyensis TaxID=2945988 RepID=A0A9X2SIW8_9PSEU|nr:Crp/Fnr family transcriptional regulator [Amycolatopsis iheyensis]MCR6483398.1 Crp/Fnr family transcriptional regulator [Amycolatopsis iheyensis]